jgi:uncharacterized protein YcbK (DUF882 family)
MHPNRRNFLKTGLSLTGASVMTGLAGQSFAKDKVDAPDRRLRLANAHTWEKLDIVYWSNGVYLDKSLDKIDFLMRDHRANQSRQMDIDLIDSMHALYMLSGSKERMHVLSGFRTAKTNAALRKRSSGVAKYSLHMEGRAVDINIPDVPTNDLRDIAVGMKTGGVGYYRKAGFVHIDTGNVRYWQQV